ncbi:MAG: SMP-30/gluconolactonase/LRE family protein [Gammaproteobacteria bacterium]|nr:SMP-30/gluconolactonase/LRE family protein [Gammaproteobacteria bacterium]
MKNRIVLLALSVLILLQGCTPVSQSPDQIVTARGGFIPEGIEYDNNNNRFLVGSLSDGTVYEITESGALIAVVTDPELMSSVGIEVDEPRNRLLVTNSDRSGGKGAAMLGVYELDSGDRLAMVNLVEAIENLPPDAIHFANDVAVSTRGVSYITDTPMNIIYKVDTYYNATVLLDLGRDSGVNINGIVFNPTGHLLVVSPGTGQLLRVPVDNPAHWSFVELDLPATGGDGIVWAADGTLAVISNNTSRVTKYASDDNWRSASVVGMASFTGQATTGAAVGDDIYVVQPHFADDEPPVLLKAKF